MNFTVPRSMSLSWLAAALALSSVPSLGCSNSTSSETNGAGGSPASAAPTPAATPSSGPTSRSVKIDARLDGHRLLSVSSLSVKPSVPVITPPGTAGVPLLLPINGVSIASTGDPCGGCGDIIADAASEACNQATVDLVDALLACSCDIGSACVGSCAGYPDPYSSIYTANGCDGAEPLGACKVCLVTPSSSTPPGCKSAWDACVADVPPSTPFVCSTAYTDAPSCGEGYTGVFPPCDFVTVNDYCVDDGNFYCPVGQTGVSCCTVDDANVGWTCVDDEAPGLVKPAPAL